MEYFVSADGVATNYEGQPVAEQVQVLTAKRQLLEAEIAAREIRHVDAELKAVNDQMAMESLRIANAEFVNRFDYLPVGFGFGNDYFGQNPLGGTFMYSSPSDRYDGRDWPFVTTEADLNYARGLARFVTKTHCPGVAVERNLKAHVIGKGGNYTAGVRKGNKAPEGLVDAVQDVLDEFIDENRIIGDGEHEWFWRGVRDGETMISTTPIKRGPGIVDAREIEPANIRDPGAPLYDEKDLQKRFGMYIDCATNWAFGVHKADHDVQKVFGYAIDWSTVDGDWDYLPDGYLEHWKRNVDRNVSRGMTDFFPAWQWLREQHRLLTNTSAGSAERAAISYIVQHVEGVTKGQAQSMRREQADYSYTIRGPSGNSNTVYKEWKPPGTKLDVPKGQEYIAIASGADPSPAYLEVVQAILRQVGVIWCMSEAMISGDDSGGSVTAAVVSGSRFDKYATMEQGSFAGFMGRVCWKVLRIAYNLGKFFRWGFARGSAGSWQKFKRLIEIIIGYPDVANRDPQQQEQIRQTRQQAGILSKKTWSDEVDLDYETEQAQIQKEQPQQQQGMPGQPGQPGMPPEQGGGGAPPPMDEEKSSGGMVAFHKPDGGIGFRRSPGMGMNHNFESLVLTQWLNGDHSDKVCEQLDLALTQAPVSEATAVVYRSLALPLGTVLKPGDLLGERSFIAVTEDRGQAFEVCRAVGERQGYVLRVALEAGSRWLELPDGCKLLARQGRFRVNSVEVRDGIGYIDARFERG